MNNKPHLAIESSYRAFYGKLFSVLISQFGASNINEIEDAIQNAFLKSLKSWNPEQIPDNKENWLYIVARNDLLNQIKKQNKTISEPVFPEKEETGTTENDLRFQTVLFISSLKNISTQTKVVFILKNIFGLNIREIGESTLINQDAIYKAINRAKKSLQSEFRNRQLTIIFEKVNRNEVLIVEEILYAVFNIGFDSFNEKIQSVVNEDLCLEALSLARLLFEKYKFGSTKNLLALFCFHIARIPAKVDNGKLVPFLKQNKSKWDKKLIELGFHYLQKHEKRDKFYIEALIAGKYMTANLYDVAHWNHIIKLYELLVNYHHSPIVKLNLCYVLHKAQRTQEALELLEKVRNDLPDGHVYFSLVKADILKETNPEESEKIISSVLNKMTHTIRREFLLENSFINL